jgi:hypothetical protein
MGDNIKQDIDKSKKRSESNNGNAEGIILSRGLYELHGLRIKKAMRRYDVVQLGHISVGGR